MNIMTRLLQIHFLAVGQLSRDAALSNCHDQQPYVQSGYKNGRDPGQKGSRWGIYKLCTHDGDIASEHNERENCEGELERQYNLEWYNTYDVSARVITMYFDTTIISDPKSSLCAWPIFILHPFSLAEHSSSIYLRKDEKEVYSFVACQHYSEHSGDDHHQACDKATKPGFQAYLTKIK